MASNLLQVMRILTKSKSHLNTRNLCLFWCTLLLLINGAVTANVPDTNDSNEYSSDKEVAQQSSGDVIMREDAEEIFYNLDLQHYHDLGIVCPTPIPPEHGYLIGEDNRVGSVVYVRCQKGYRLVGPTVMACVPKGDTAGWDADIERECVETSSTSTDPMDEGAGVIENPPEEEDEDVQMTDGNAVPRPIDDPRFWKQRINTRDEEEDEISSQREILDQLPPECQQPPRVGPCKAMFNRFYFDTTAMECRSFTYGGCLGNQNNFESMEECDSTCLSRGN